jgi:predicted HicB family RNase H-like nuclease
MNRKKMTLRIPAPLHKKVQEKCKQERISFNKRMIALIEWEFGDENQKKEAIVL